MSTCQQVGDESRAELGGTDPLAQEAAAGAGEGSRKSPSTTDSQSWLKWMSTRALFLFSPLFFEQLLEFAFAIKIA